MDETLGDAEHRMQSAVGALDRDLDTVRTGRARPALVEALKVEYYGTPTPLNQMAAIHAPEPRLLTIQPWDKTQLGTIEKAIQKSDLGLTPTNDGNIIRLVVPALTEDRRKELVKVVHKKVEEARVAVRNVRRDSLDQLRKLQHDKQISDDDGRRAQERLQKLTDRYISDVDKHGQAKEQELLEV
ncbi:MAG TPA: ribosome recycling factor [Dehalococcoidia bacterium]|nr:ribosome recycling factor [Dehalococcoidia bacterium]